MINVDSLLYKIDQKLNKLSSNEHQQIALEDKILSLNEAQLTLIKQKVSGFSTIPGMGLDSFKKRYEDLQNLCIHYKDGKLPLKKGDENINEWIADITKLKPDYMFYLDSYIIASKGRCKDRIIWINKELAKHGDLQFLINNDNYKPSFEYQETFNFISSNQISIFTDNTFEPSHIYISYIRYPVYINKQGYEMLDGSASLDANCELPLYMEDELVDLAVKNLAMYTENVSAAQSAQNRISTSE